MRDPIKDAVGARPNQRGTTIVEAAIFLTVFFMFLFGVMEAGRFLQIQQVLTNAAREGARFAVSPETAETCATNCMPTQAEIIAMVDTFMASAGLSGHTVTVDQAFMKPVVEEEFVNTVYTLVTVTFDYRVLTVPSFFDVLDVTIQGEAMMRNETSP